MELQAKTPASKSSCLKFSPASWWGDTARLTLEAKALWLEMLLLMHVSPKRGYLLNADGKFINAGDIAKRLKIEKKHAISICNELENSGVFSRNSEGVIYSRRMVREQARIEKEINEAKGEDEAVKIEQVLKLSRERGVDVALEMKKLQAYLLAHPDKRYCLKFVTGWMNRAIPTLAPKRKERPNNFHCYSPPTGRPWCGLGSKEAWEAAGKPSEEDLILRKRELEGIPA